MTDPTSAEPGPTALIAEDEPLLAASLKKQLRDAWPELRIAAEAGDGETAIVRALDALPDMLFLDIRMPGKSGLEVAETVVDEWPETRPAPLVVFVTAYDEFALAAFDREALDYVLKPVTPERLQRTVVRLRERLAVRTMQPASDHLATLLDSLQDIARAVAPAGTAAARGSGVAPLDIVQVGRGASIDFVPVGEVLFFEATDKYVAVHARGREGLIRMSMRELLAQLDPAVFMQVHRSVVVNRLHIAAATRDETGHVTLTLRDSPRTIAVSRAFVHRFRAM